MGLALLLGLAALLLLAMFLTWRLVLRPVGELATATERVAAGDLTARVPVPSSDEIARTATSFNVMVEKLAKARRELEDWSRTLEDRVEAKTAELSDAHDRMLVVEKMASLGKLAAVVAHEINNPLAGIATYAKTLRKKFARLKEEAAPAGEVAPPGLEEDTLSALELVQTEASRCGTIVQNLLLFSRTPGARFAEQDLGAILERCALLVSHKAELQEIDVQLQVDGGGAEGRVRRVADPAGRAGTDDERDRGDARRGTVKLHVMNATDMDREGVLLEVVDTGCGIPSEDVAARLRALLHARRRKGRAWVSALRRLRDRGAPPRPVERVLDPRRGHHVQDPPAASAARGTRRGAGTGGRRVMTPKAKKAALRILVVDDETIVRESLDAWLREDGHEVDVADSARQALRQVAAETLRPRADRHQDAEHGRPGAADAARRRRRRTSPSSS